MLAILVLVVMLVTLVLVASRTGVTNTGASTSPTVQVAPVLATMVLVAQCAIAQVI